jgi:glycine cleavage system H lipoate-binding protein
MNELERDDPFGTWAVESGNLPPQHQGPAEKTASTYLGQLTEGCDLHLDLPYSTGHFWLQEEGPDRILLGFDCQTLRLLYPVEDFRLPDPGVWVKRGEPMGWVIRGKLAIPLPAPMSGEVLDVNHLLVNEVKEGGFPRSTQQWLIRLRPHEPLADVPDLLRGEAMLSWYQKKLTLVHSYLLNAVDSCAAAGETMNDGGAVNRNLEEVLGPDAFRELLGRLFRGV